MNFRRHFSVLLFFTFCAQASIAADAPRATETPPSTPSDSVSSQAWNPFSIRLYADDAEHFARLFTAHAGALSAAQLQDGYLQGASRGVEIFTPQRIRDAENLAKKVAALREDYAYAIEHCLPMLDELNDEMRSIYLAFRGLLPQQKLPEVYVVFGAGNSGGTAAPDAQVLGLEVACKKGTTRAAFRKYMRMMFAHESVHSWQEGSEQDWLEDPVLFSALGEGTAEYLAHIVLGSVPDPERDAWAKTKGESVWLEFAQDRMRVRKNSNNAMSADTAEGKAYLRWFANYGSAPEGWPYEAGYWVGRQIAAQYVARASDKNAAIKRLLSLKDPQGILRDSGVVLTP